MQVVDRIHRTKDYCSDHLGIKIREFWLTKAETDELVAYLTKTVPMVTDPKLAGNTDMIFCGMVIKTAGQHDHMCPHDTRSHFADLNEVYCHDCRTIIGEGVPSTYRRHSNVGTN